MSRTEALAAFFRSRPNQWVSALDLMEIAGRLSWRTRISNVRKAPHYLDIRNRMRTVQANGRRVVLSEYKYMLLVEMREEPKEDERRAPSEGHAPPSLLLF